MKIGKDEFDKALDSAYQSAGHNAFFGNGFSLGVKFAFSKMKPKPLKWEEIRKGMFRTYTAMGKVDVYDRIGEWGLDIERQNLIKFPTPEEAKQEAYRLHCEKVESFY